MRYKTYAEIAKVVGIDHCGEEGPVHDVGYISRDEQTTIHWQERRVTRSGIRRFLMAVATEMIPPPTCGCVAHPRWLRLWESIEWTRAIAREKLHTSVPPELWAEDKARLAAQLTNRWRDGHDEEAAQALRWTRR